MKFKSTTRLSPRSQSLEGSATETTKRRFDARLLAVILVLCLLAVAPSLAVASGAAPAPTTSSGSSVLDGSAAKQEVVYSTLANDGAVEGVYVVNVLNAPAEGATVYDYGVYDAVHNLTDAREIDYANGRTTIPDLAGRFSYQGDLKSTELPWIITVDYSLDGRKVDASELSGASGTLGISLTSRQNRAVASSYFENYLLTSTIMLNQSVASDIIAPDASIALSGSDYQITFMTMPGKESSYHLEAQVQDFSMEGISIAATPFSMAIEAPDSSGLTGGMTELADGVRQIGDGAGSLAEGATALDQNVGSFASGALALAGGVDELAQGTGGVNQGATSLDEASRSLAEGISSTAGGLGQISQQADAFSQGLSQAAAGGDELAQGSSAFAAQLGDLSATGSALSAQLSELFAQLSKLAPSEAGDFQAYDAQLTAYFDAISQLSSSYELQMDPALQSYVAAIDELAASHPQLAYALAQAASGAGALSEGAAGLSAGTSQLADALAQVDAGAQQLSSSSGDLASGARSLSSGTHSLSEGATQLAEGASTLSTEVQGLPDRIQQEVDKMMAEYDKSDFSPMSFTSAQNDQVSLVQFVMTTRGVAAPEAAPVETPQEEEGFFDRLLDLFGL